MQAEVVLSDFEIDVLRRRDRDMWTYQQLAAHYGSTRGEISRIFIEARHKRDALMRDFLRTVDPEQKITPTATVRGLADTYTAFSRANLQRQSAGCNLFEDEAYHHAIAVCNEIYLQLFDAGIAAMAVSTAPVL